MSDVKKFLDTLADQTSANADLAGNYVDADGVTRCAKCGDRRIAFVPIVGREIPVACRCRQEQEAAAQRTQARLDAELSAKTSILYERGYKEFTFKNDAFPESEASKQFRAYVERWDVMRAKNYGVIAFGPVGVGKTFYAGCVVNALRSEGVYTIICTAPAIIAAARATGDVRGIIHELNRFELVALDDIGSEHETDFTISVLEAFINVREIAKKPLIVTSNLTYQQMRNPTDLRWARTFSRLLNLCPHAIVIDGADMRKTSRKERAAECRDIICGKEVPQQ